jgi:hypothetical protein
VEVGTLVVLVAYPLDPFLEKDLVDAFHVAHLNEILCPENLLVCLKIVRMIGLKTEQIHQRLISMLLPTNLVLTFAQTETKLLCW